MSPSPERRSASSPAAAPSWGFDHAVVFVPRLGPAVELYRSQGLDAVPGGRHDGVPTHNAIVATLDGGYLELIAPAVPGLAPLLRTLGAARLLHGVLRRRTALQRRFLRGFGGAAGAGDFCLWTDSLDRALATARQRGLEVEGPWRMGRKRADGYRIEWRLALPVDPELPFLIEDHTPRSERVPRVAGKPGSLFASRVAEVAIRVNDTTAAAAKFTALLGIQPDRPNGAAAEFEFGGTRISLRRPGRDARDRGPVRVSIAVEGEPPPLLPAVDRHGVRLIRGP